MPDRIPPIDLTTAEPFYLLLRSDGSAEDVTLGGDRCLCVFTDVGLVEPFYLGRYGNDFTSRQVGTLFFDGPKELLKFLRSNEAPLAIQGIKHLAVDPAPRRSIARVPVRAFIEAADPPR